MTVNIAKLRQLAEGYMVEPSHPSYNEVGEALDECLDLIEQSGAIVSRLQEERNDALGQLDAKDVELTELRRQYELTKQHLDAMAIAAESEYAEARAEIERLRRLLTGAREQLAYPQDYGWYRQNHLAELVEEIDAALKEGK